MPPELSTALLDEDGWVEEARVVGLFSAAPKAVSEVLRRDWDRGGLPEDAKLFVEARFHPCNYDAPSRWFPHVHVFVWAGYCLDGVVVRVPRAGAISPDAEAELRALWAEALAQATGREVTPLPNSVVFLAGNQDSDGEPGPLVVGQRARDVLAYDAARSFPGWVYQKPRSALVQLKCSGAFAWRSWNKLAPQLGFVRPPRGGMGFTPYPALPAYARLVARERCLRPDGSPAVSLQDRTWDAHLASPAEPDRSGRCACRLCQPVWVLLARRSWAAYRAAFRAWERARDSWVPGEQPFPEKPKRPVDDPFW